MPARTLRTLSLLTVFILAVSSYCLAQSDTPAIHHQKVFGFQDTRTGTFHPLRRGEMSPDATTTPASGTYQVTFNIKIVSTFVKGTTILCEVSVDAESDNSTTDLSVDYSEAALSTATVSGSTATCTVNVPYSWAIAPSSSSVTNTVTGSYGIVAYSGTPTSTYNDFFLGEERESDSQIFTTNTLPANGSTTKYTLTPTI